jgi:dolichyl-diphosphooligosaccharide--protein glycosyltransferase
VKGSKENDEYTKQYFEGLSKSGNSRDGGQGGGKQISPPNNIPKLSAEVIEMINEDWTNNEITSAMWEQISQGNFAGFADTMQNYPRVAHARSEDGRGPMWWAYENKRPRMIELLKKMGVSDERTDQNGIRAKDVGK